MRRKSLIVLAIIVALLLSALLSSCRIFDKTLQKFGLEKESIGSSRFYSITKYSGTSEDIVLPNSHRNKPIVKIKKGAFKSNKTLKSIVIPESIKEIEDDAFKDCVVLAKVEIKSNITSIPDNAFEGCVKLSEINIPESVVAIGDSSFKDCQKLQDIKFGKNIREIGDSSFLNCKNLYHISLPETIEKLGYNCFAKCTNLHEVEIAENSSEDSNSNYINIGLNVFENTSDNLVVFVSESKKDIYKSMENWDQYASRIQTLGVLYDFNDGASSYSFLKYSGHDTDFNIPQYYKGLPVTKIAKEAFKNAKNLNSIRIPEGIESIEDGAFLNCLFLNSVSIPNSVKRIGNSAFENCERLASIFLNSNNHVIIAGSKMLSFANPDLKIFVKDDLVDQYKNDANWGKYSSQIFKTEFEFSINDETKSIVLQKYIGDSKYLVVPSYYNGFRVSEIAESAFVGSQDLVSITIPVSIKKIGDRAFNGCTKLEDIYIQAEENDEAVVNAGKFLFENVHKNLTIYVSNQKVRSNYVEATNWLVYKNKIRCFDFGMKYANPNKTAYTLTSYADVNLSERDALDSNYKNTVIIPNSYGDLPINVIGSRCFFESHRINAVIVPTSINKLEANCFEGCIKLSAVYLTGDAKIEGSKDMFKYTDATLKIYVKSEDLKTQYSSDPNWSAYADKLVVAS